MKLHSRYAENAAVYYRIALSRSPHVTVRLVTYRCVSRAITSISCKPDRSCLGIAS